MRHLLLPLLTLGSCDPSGPRSQGWAPARSTGGPTVVWDAEAKPLPEVPLPNDAATRLDPTSPTGRRLNISLDATTAYEREIRGEFNQMDGFGTYAPLMVSFTAPLDLDDLWSRHNDNEDYRDDAVYLLNVDPACARYGEEVGLDLGGRRTPVTFYDRSARTPDADAPGGYRLQRGGNPLFLFDNHADSRSVHYEQWNEDTNANGRLDPGEDHDLDGVLDVANFRDPGACDDLDPTTQPREYDGCVVENIMSWYDRTSDTLVLRPLWPMEERCVHAVVLTRRLTGEDGRSIQSPFAAVNARDQTADLQEATPLLSRYGLTLDDVAFAWTFHTGSVTSGLRAAREGLHGRGPFASWEQRFPAEALHFWTRTELAAVLEQEASPEVAEDRYLPGGCAGAGFTWFWDEGQGEWDANLCAIEADMSTISMLTFATFEAPNLLVDKDGDATPQYAHEQDERWDLDPVAGTATAATTEIPLWCALPYERDDVSCSEGNPEGQPWCKPFPVALFLHGYGSNRNEMSLHMGRHTAMGMAACGMDMPGHGLNRWRQDPEAAVPLALATGQMLRYGVPEFSAVLTIGRDRDLNNDGFADSGADQWTADVFHTRDMVRQEALEHMQLVRILRSIDGREAEDGTVLGDIDGDGAPDLGGPENTIGAWGISLGGIVSGVLAGAEPALDAVSPNAGGGGLTDISTRASLGGVTDAVLGPMVGPFIAGCLPMDAHDRAVTEGEGSDCAVGSGLRAGPYPAGQLRLFQLAHDAAKMRLWEFGAVPGVQPGDRIRLENLANGEVKETVVNERGWFRLSVPSDALDAIEKRVALGMSDGQTAATATDPEALGDALVLSILRGAEQERIHTVDTFIDAVTFQGITYPAGSTLVALQRGLGLDRSTPELRRFTAIAQHAVNPADPAAWAPFIRETPLDTAGDPTARPGGARTLIMPTAGDKVVPANTGIAHARAAGLLGSWTRDPENHGPESGWRAIHAPDPRYGTSIDRWLVQTWTVEGDAQLERFPDNPDVQAVVFDPDDASDGTALFSCGYSDWSALIGENNCPEELRGQEVFFPVPGPGPGGALRQDSPRGDGTLDGFRLPLLRPGGQHGIYNAQSFRMFDADAYAVNQTVRFLRSRGGTLDHEAGCDCSAAGLPNFTYNGEPEDPGLEAGCTTDDLRICDAACNDAWGLWIPEEAACERP